MSNSDRQGMTTKKRQDAEELAVTVDENFAALINGSLYESDSAIYIRRQGLTGMFSLYLKPRRRTHGVR
jgi:hypothetical protein